MTVTHPSGFRAAGSAVGLKPSGRPDLTLVVNDGPSDAVAAVYTSNRCKANPVLWSETAGADGRARAVVLNSGGANCYTGSFGFQTSHMTAERAGELLDVSAQDVLICSTGLIGVGGQDFRDRILGGLPDLVTAAGSEPRHGQDSAEAIMTTDTVPKTIERTAQVDGAAGAPGEYRMGGMAKGAGMLAPGLATMLVVLTTDADLPAAVLDRALRTATAQSFDRLDTDGCMSTNDTVILMASGASGATPDEGSFTELLTDACLDLMRQLHVDAEGAHHDIAITTSGAASVAEAVAVSRSVARSNLFKAAIFGEDPNWGRVVAQVGTTDATFDPARIDVTINGVRVCTDSTPDDDPESVVFTREVTVEIDLKSGPESATVWTSDLTHDYVEENSAYST